MPGITDFLQAIGSNFGSGPDQLGLSDILGAVGQAVGPTLAARGGRIGMPLGFGLSTVGALGETLSDRKTRSAQITNTVNALRGMLPLVKDKVPGAEGLLQGVQAGGVTPEDWLKYVEEGMKPAKQFEPQFFMDAKGAGKWVMPGETPPAGFTPKDVYKSGEQKKEDEARRFQEQKQMEDIRQGNREDLRTLGASLRPPREGSFTPLYDKDGNIIGKWDAHSGAPSMFPAPVKASKTPPKTGTAKGGKPQFTTVAGEKIGINPISGLPFAAGAATGAPSGYLAGFLGGGTKPPKPPEVMKIVLKMSASLAGNPPVKGPDGRYIITGKDGAKYHLTNDATWEPE